jgi:hypothetical protein
VTGGAGNRPRRRRPAEETRALMLRAGTTLAIERLRTAEEAAASHALAHIRLTEVAAAATALAGEPGARITTGAIYQLWPSQAAFQSDLMLHILGLEPLPAGDRLLPHAQELIAAGRPVDEIVAALADLAFAASRREVAYELGLLFVPYARVPRVGDALRAAYAALWEDAAPIYAALLAHGGRRVRAPWTVDDLAAALSALHEGFDIRSRVEPAAVRTRGGRSVVAEASVALFDAFTEPAPAAGSADGS